MLNFIKILAKTESFIYYNHHYLVITMLDLKNFEDEELDFLRTRLEALIEEQLITGINGYSEIFDFDVCLPISYLHHSKQHKKQLSEKLANHKRLKILADTWKTRDKRAIYWWDPEWPIKDEEKEQGIAFYILKNWQKIKDELIKKSTKIRDFYDGDDLIVAQDKGYDLNFEVDSKVTLLGLINLFRKYITPFLTDKDGNPIYDEHGKRKTNPDKIIEAYRVPVIVYKDKFKIFKGNIRGFKPILKLSIIRKNEELNTYIDQKYSLLQQRKPFQEIQSSFAKEYSEIEVYANALFVNHINGIRLP